MFVTIDTTTQHVSDMSGQALIASGVGRKATAQEASDCVMRLVCKGLESMNAANDDFKKAYGNDK